MSKNKSWLVDVPVLCIFFVRDDCFSKSFEAVRQARPSKLLLWQDGPRNEKDMEGIMKCRKIAENIDWDCEVYRCYNEKNYGCDPSTFYSHKWAFSLVDKCIILEDDVVPDQSFFHYCKELLDKYEHDVRINKICGMNQVKGFECPESYFFSSIGSVWGWATWKRVADTWEENYDFLENEYAMKLVRNWNDEPDFQSYEKTCLAHAKEGVPHWETVQTYSRYLNSQLCIIPAVNIVENVGMGPNSTHSNITLECLPHSFREIFYCNANEIEFPLKHPKYIIDNVEYKKRYYKLTGKGYPIIQLRHNLEGIVLQIRHLGLIWFIKKVIKKLRSF